MERMVLPKKLNDQYKFADALEEYVYNNPNELNFLDLLEKKRIPGSKLRFLAANNPYVAEKIENIKEVMSNRWLKAWTQRDSNYREDPSGKMFRYYNKEYDAWLREIEVAKTTAAIERNALRKAQESPISNVINVVVDEVEKTPELKAWKENADRSRIESSPEQKL